MLELPGVAKEDVKFSLKSHVDLIVNGVIRALYPIEMEVEKLRYYGDFERVVRLPEPTEAQLISLHFQHGLVYVTYPIQVGENVKQI
ncbi:Hsp20/alpha crystallin family protein [Peribacillus frigoritolerans]|uniref:Hsp20/alpha crystallin family protein n=1 Tax=Peribacillus frigoritolerans TaxID=450367 RepID=UPI0014046258|nr:Hsp20/alpha crystallin family protein [Peribacillus frigoritolerans]